ncbi:MAG: glycoside hydrolase family 3 C-terminal domain-containing protein [Clostridia bacterium]|nr:glycoside hydrolase family 3 C-terminal domain-containing protein [Clostridia bacterium]
MNTKWMRIKYQPNIPLKDGKYVTASEEHIAISRKAAGEGMVLLKNDGLLPLKDGSRVSLFGKGLFDYVKGGGGSGDVNTTYIRQPYDAIAQHAGIFEPLADFYRVNVEQQYSHGAVPGMTEEPELPQNLLDDARAFSDTAIIFISRFSGEGWDRSSVEVFEPTSTPPKFETLPQIAGRLFPKGDFYLASAERKLLDRVAAAFPRVIAVLNVGGIIDTGWIKNDAGIGAALLEWQGGMEGASAAADILFGHVNPSGKLPDTFAYDLDDYPSTAGFHEDPFYVNYTEDIYVGYRYFETLPGKKDRVCYPFGYGLSYTTFTIETVGAQLKDDTVEVKVSVTNTGKVPGKEVIQLYYSAPQGLLGKPARELGAFAKTKELEPGETQCVELKIRKDDMASFDDLGKICKSAYVLEKGTYLFYMGTDVRRAGRIDFSITLDADELVHQCSSLVAPSKLKERMRADGSMEPLPAGPVNDPNACIFPKLLGGVGNDYVPAVRGLPMHLRWDPVYPGTHSFNEVVNGTLSMDGFIAQLKDEDMISMTGGQPNLSVANTFGIGNLAEYDVPNAMTADGPAGIRIHKEYGVSTTALPCATLLASTWNTELIEEAYCAGAEELKENNLAVWLAPALNIHRNPMCGRNFEYYSEDPLLAGAAGSAAVKGIQKNGVSACIKHFACNNKETNRKHSDSRLSERALREIYLRAFEIIVKTAEPWAIMSSYNIINGHRASECRELLTDILRGEWGYSGIVMSDWWNRAEQYKELAAGNDVKMPTGFPDRVRDAMEQGALDRKDLEISAKRILEFLMKLD